MQHILKKYPDIESHPALSEIIDYIDKLESKIIDLEFDKNKSNELTYEEMLNQIRSSIIEHKNNREEEKRFKLDIITSDEDAINNLLNYILDMKRIHKLFNI